MLPFLYLYAVPDTLLLHKRVTLRWVRHNSAAQPFNALYRKVPANFIGYKIYLVGRDDLIPPFLTMFSHLDTAG